jgi:hypothetical protein
MPYGPFHEEKVDPNRFPPSGAARHAQGVR